MKTCSVCNQEKEECAFPKGRKLCKVCTQIQNKERMAERMKSAHTITKKCTKCSETKVGTEFPGLRNVCRPCFSKNTSETNNRPSEDAPNKICRKCEVEQPAKNFRHQEATCKACNKKKLYEWREENMERHLQICKKYRDKDTSKEKRAIYLRNKYSEDLMFRVETLYRNRIRLCIKKKHIPKNTPFDYASVLGCPYEILLSWLEFNMSAEMNWDNYGTYWHIDHVLPVSSFDFSKQEDRERCFNWTNLNPLEGVENIRKSNKICDEMVINIRKRAIEFLENDKEVVATILTDPLPREIREYIESGVLTTKDDVKASSGSGEKSEVR